MKISAVIAAGVHLFPFRTEKLSPLAPMVLGGQPPGRVGRRPVLHAGEPSAPPRLFREAGGSLDPPCRLRSQGTRRSERRRGDGRLAEWFYAAASLFRQA